MSRVLAHFVPREMALLIAFELFLSSALVYVIIGTPAGSGVLTGGLSPLSLGGGALGAVSALIIGVLAATIGLYRPEICLNPVRVLVITTTAAVIAAPLLLLFGAAGQAHRFDDIVLWLGEILGLWFAVLMATRITYSKLIKDHVTMRRVLVVDTEEAAAPLMALLKQRHGHQFNVMRAAAGPETLSLDTIARSGVWGVVLTDGCMDQLAADSLLDMKMRGVRVFDAVRFQENYLGRIDLASINMEWLIKADGFSSSRAAAVFKRVFDITTSVLLLVSTLPVMVITAMLVKLDSPGPVFYRQQRAGYAGAPFTLFKFRSMSVDAEAGGKPRWAQKHDPRVTRVGQFIRQTRIDELPQLFNVLRGDMSMIGPRPERPHFVDELALAIPFYREREYFKPGITGWAQVNFPYGASVDDAREKLAYDLYYVKNRSIALDILIFCSTVRIILFREGAR